MYDKKAIQIYILFYDGSNISLLHLSILRHFTISR